MSLWHVDYFQLKKNQGPKGSGRNTDLAPNFDLAPCHLKNLNKGPITGI